MTVARPDRKRTQPTVLSSSDLVNCNRSAETIVSFSSRPDTDDAMRTKCPVSIGGPLPPSLPVQLEAYQDRSRSAVQVRKVERRGPYTAHSSCRSSRSARLDSWIRLKTVQVSFDRREGEAYALTPIRKLLLPVDQKVSKPRDRPFGV